MDYSFLGIYIYIYSFMDYSFLGRPVAVRNLPILWSEVLLLRGDEDPRPRGTQGRHRRQARLWIRRRPAGPDVDLPAGRRQAANAGTISLPRRPSQKVKVPAGVFLPKEISPSSSGAGVVRVNPASREGHARKPRSDRQKARLAPAVLWSQHQLSQGQRCSSPTYQDHQK